MTISAVIGSFQAAVRTDVESASAGRGYVLQVLDTASAPAVANAGGFQPIWQSAGTVGAASREVPVELRSTTPGQPVPALVKTGSMPTVSGQGLISQRAADLLGVVPGSTVTVFRQTPVTVKITGISRDTARRDTMALVFLENEDPDRVAAIWVGNSNPFKSETLLPLIEQRKLTARTIDVVATEQAGDALVTTLQSLRFVVPSLTVLSLVLLISILLLLRRVLAGDARALIGIGMSRRQVYGVLIRATAVCGVVGAVLGVALPILGLWAFKSPVSAQFGQDWAAVKVDPQTIITTAVGLPLGAVIGVALIKWSSQLGRRLPRLPKKASLIAAGVALGVSGLLVVAGGPFQVAPLYLLVAALIATAVGWRLAAAGVGPGTSVVTTTLARSLTPLALLTAILVFGTTWYTALNLHNSLASEALWRPQQPVGSLLVNGVGPQGRETIFATYKRLGGHRVARYQLADERQSTLRITAPSTVECISKSKTRNILDVPSDCYPPDARTSLNIIALSDELKPNQLVADPELIKDGKAGLLNIAVPDGMITSAGTVDATNSSELGGYMPGALVSPQNPVAAKFGLKPTPYEFLVLFDMHQLSPDGQAELRGIIRKAAGAAQVAEDIGYVDETGQRELSRMTALVGFSIAALFIGGLGMAFAGTHVAVRRVLRDLGLTTRRRLMLATRFSAPVLLSVIAGASLGLLAAWMSGAHDGSGFGWTWVLPGAGGLIAYVALVGGYSKLPNRNET